MIIYQVECPVLPKRINILYFSMDMSCTGTLCNITTFMFFGFFYCTHILQNLPYLQTLDDNKEPKSFFSLLQKRPVIYKVKENNIIFPCPQFQNHPSWQSYFIDDLTVYLPNFLEDNFENYVISFVNGE